MAAGIITKVLIEDVLCEAFPDLIDAEPSTINAQVALLRPALNRVIQAYRTPQLPIVMARQRARISKCSMAATAAFDLFVANMTDC